MAARGSADNHRCFKNIAELIRTKRIDHAQGYSQSELSHLLGYKNGQFISNVERALCNIPLKMLGKVGEILGISQEELKAAILKDHEITLDNYFAATGIKKEQEGNRGGVGTSKIVAGHTGASAGPRESAGSASLAAFKSPEND